MSEEESDENRTPVIIAGEEAPNEGQQQNIIVDYDSILVSSWKI